MAEFVQDVEDVRTNLRTLHDYLVHGNEEERHFARERLRNGYNLVAATVAGDVIFGPSRVVGYRQITLARHRALAEEGILNGRDTNPELVRMLGKQISRGDTNWIRLEELYLRLCEQLNVIPVNRERRYWQLDSTGASSSTPAEAFSEGTLSYHVTTRYERDQAARQACINAHGTTCVCCGFDFEAVYGERGRGFIHVHHLQPLSQAAGKRDTDPTKDLVPVCPNCHYMLHRGGNVLSPDDLRKLMKPR